MPLNYYERKLYELLKGLTEADKFYARNPDGKKISVFTDKDNYQDAVKSGGYEPVDREEAEAELSGQKGEKPAEKPKPKQAKIAADPFADKGPEGDDTPKDKSKEDNMKGVPSQFPESELAEEPFDHDDYDEDMESEIADEVVAYFIDNADKEAMKDYTEEEMMDFVQAQSEKLVAKYQQPDGVPNEKRSMLAYRNDLIDNVRFELGYADGEAGFDAGDKPAGGKDYGASPENKKAIDAELDKFPDGHKPLPSEVQQSLDDLMKAAVSVKPSPFDIRTEIEEPLRALKKAGVTYDHMIHAITNTLQDTDMPWRKMPKRRGGNTPEGQKETRKDFVHNMGMEMRRIFGEDPQRPGENEALPKFLSGAMYNNKDMFSHVPGNAPQEVAKPEILDFLSGIADAGERGAGFDNDKVRNMVIKDLKVVKKKGGSVKDIAVQLKKQAQYMNPEDFELADQAAEEIFGEKIPHGVSDDEIGTAHMEKESVQPFKEQYNRLFESLGGI